MPPWWKGLWTPSKRCIIAADAIFSLTSTLQDSSLTEFDEILLRSWGASFSNRTFCPSLFSLRYGMLILNSILRVVQKVAHNAVEKYPFNVEIKNANDLTSVTRAAVISDSSGKRRNFKDLLWFFRLDKTLISLTSLKALKAQLGYRIEEWVVKGHPQQIF